jgi:hypothetical protein
LTARTVSSPSTLSWCFTAPWATVICISACVGEAPCWRNFDASFYGAKS